MFLYFEDETKPSGSKFSPAPSSPSPGLVSHAVPSVVAACFDSSMLTFQFRVDGMPIALGVDTGAPVNLLSYSAFQVLNSKLSLTLESSDVTLTSVQGTPLKVNGR